jgi:SAM-dependent methyltransferase
LTEWYDTFFDALAHDVWDGLVPDEASDLEADWLVGALDLHDDRLARVLDVPSGRGRHARRLAARGHDVVAVDFAVAAIEALARAGVPHLTALQGDMRDLGAVLTEPAWFDAACCMGNSFGYLDDAATERFVAGVARVLRPGARFVVDASTVAEALLPRLDTDGVDRHTAGGVALTNEHHYDVRTSALVTRMVLERGDERAERTVVHRVLAAREVVAALARAGFDVERIDGDLDGQEFVVGSPRCLVRAVRRVGDAPG